MIILFLQASASQKPVSNRLAHFFFFLISHFGADARTQVGRFGHFRQLKPFRPIGVKVARVTLVCSGQNFFNERILIYFGYFFGQKAVDKDVKTKKHNTDLDRSVLVKLAIREL